MKIKFYINKNQEKYSNISLLKDGVKSIEVPIYSISSDKDFVNYTDYMEKYVKSVAYDELTKDIGTTILRNEDVQRKTYLYDVKDSRLGVANARKNTRRSTNKTVNALKGKFC